MSIWYYGLLELDRRNKKKEKRKNRVPSWTFSHQFFLSFSRYCVAGTIGHKLMSGKPTKIDLDKDTQIDVRCQVQLHLLPFTIISTSFFFKNVSIEFSFIIVLHMRWFVYKYKLKEVFFCFSHFFMIVLLYILFWLPDSSSVFQSSYRCQRDYGPYQISLPQERDTCSWREA